MMVSCTLLASSVTNANFPIDPVTSTVVHSSGTVVATCSGQRCSNVMNDDDTSDIDSKSDTDTGSSTNESSSDSDSSSDDSSDDHSSMAGLSLPTPSRVPDNSIKVWRL